MIEGLADGIKERHSKLDCTGSKVHKGSERKEAYGGAMSLVGKKAIDADVWNVRDAN